MEKVHKSEFGVVGLGVMGKSLSMNLVDKGVYLSVFNRHIAGKEEDIAKNFVQTHAKGNHLLGFDQIEHFVASIECPRKILIMVNAGQAVDQMIDQLIEFMDPGDIIIDGVNSHYEDTNRIAMDLQKKQIEFIGCGISGGEEGALNGPSIMPGGSIQAYRQIEDYLEGIAAKDNAGNACCTHIGPGGAGHFVKMIHNGIEYADMQLIAEFYHLMRYGMKMSPEEISKTFSEWSINGSDSYLLNITTDILIRKEDDSYLIDLILDAAGQKGTGGWSTIAALQLGKPISTISEAVMARNLSGMKELRLKTANVYDHSFNKVELDRERLLTFLKPAYDSARIVNHAIGFDVLAEASIEYGWKINLSETARIWTNGCIIRSELMELLSSSYRKHPNEHLLLHPEIVDILKPATPTMSIVLSQGFGAGYAMPVLAAAFNYFYGITSDQSPANIIQAQRDYFGAHTYKRKGASLNQSFHTNWID